MSTQVLKDIRKQTIQDLKNFLEEKGEKGFRAKQIYEWIWNKSASSFDEMTNLSIKTRDLLKESFAFQKVTIAQKQVSSDKTIKVGFRLFDGNLVEGVLIPADDRMTACVSSQVGCSLTCKFCATGYMERKRNLEPGEIYDQVVLIRQLAEEHYNTPLTNIVFMGMGEPLLNYANVLKGIEMISSPEGLNMASKRITLSTAGVAKMIKKLADDEVKFNLALSLHAANDVKRNEIMPINETNSLEALGEALRYFYKKTGTRVTYEYIVFHDVNDKIEDARELYEFSKIIPCKINIIEYNPIAEASYVNAKEDRIEKFRAFLEAKGVTVNVRRSRGKDIDAACGQLAIKEKPGSVA
ncbi:ribosomal RNA large subunit methyltransferase N [Sporocytophaga myxococcoides]|uniref:Probable dual-specificity RNA methyltransferase RlmN n=1 Tax=Sporocytophaga myxococcoides TaxID=153721 RepID=A0A098LBW8_9BACT|nr:23S rRNA (adenine(2503)-C(2))-methyltransferase RlmN [Sporocytophaga myxococcoides]GAL83917.1 ribosomal RNA large subunit methyltransferase N [Sporocytophaga myxococcoides]